MLPVWNGLNILNGHAGPILFGQQCGSSEVVHAGRRVPQISRHRQIFFLEKSAREPPYIRRFKDESFW